MKYLLLLIVVLGISCGVVIGYDIEQKTTKWLDKGYNVETLLWKDGEIVWSHYTFQEWSLDNPRSYIPLDSVPAAKKRDYETAQRVMKLMKENNFQP